MKIIKPTVNEKWKDFKLNYLKQLTKVKHSPHKQLQN